MRLPLALLLAVLALTLGCDPALAVDIAGVRFDEHMTVEARETMLNGAGLRRMLFFKAYVIGLYVPQRHGTIAEILTDPGPKRIRVVVMRDLSAEQITDAIVPILRMNLSERELQTMASRIDQLRSTVRSIELARAGTTIHLDWLPASGVTRIVVNGSARGQDIPGEDFYNALLKVWLGDNVNDRPLRDKLLGKENAS